MEQTHTVIVIIEAKSGKENLLKEQLLKVAELSRNEESCLDYRVHQNPDKPTEFSLYEQWKSPELHKEQFTKPYIVEFGKQAEELLTKPYVAFMGKKI